MSDMSQVIIPKSDQLNADDLIAGPITIKITDVIIRAGQEQPISICFEGDGGKPYKACKSMCRVMVTAWGPDSSKYKGRSMTLYRDPRVKWGGMEVGGIRISHMSHIDEPMTMALTVTRANRKPFTVKPLASGAQSQPKAADQPAEATARSQSAAASAGGDLADNQAASAAPSDDEALLLTAREWAELGTVKYSEWFENLTAAQQKKIGRKRHDEFWEVAEKATQA